VERHHIASLSIDAINFKLMPFFSFHAISETKSFSLHSISLPLLPSLSLSLWKIKMSVGFILWSTANETKNLSVGLLGCNTGF
jgi:hypothetical protein